MLRSAASTADRENHEKITNDILLDAAEDAREDARAQIKQKSLDSLTQHQRVVYDIVRDHGPLGPSKIHDRYTEAVDDPQTKRTVHLSFEDASVQPPPSRRRARVETESIHSSIRQRPHRCSKLLSVSSNSLHTRHMANFSR